MYQLFICARCFKDRDEIIDHYKFCREIDVQVANNTNLEGVSDPSDTLHRFFQNALIALSLIVMAPLIVAAIAFFWITDQ